MKYLLLLCLLSGCARLVIPPDVKPYVDKFVQVDPRHIPINNLIVRFTDEFDNTDTNGQCDRPLVGTPVILLNRDSWSYIDPTTKEILVFHELGHCILDRKHRMDYGWFKGETEGVPWEIWIPVSIMYPSSINLIVGYYYENPEPFWKELFEFDDGYR